MEATAPDLLSPDIRRYTPLAVFHRSRFMTVVLVRESDSERLLVARRLQPPTQVKGLHTEEALEGVLTALHKLKEAGIVGLYDWNVTSSGVWIVSSYVQGTVLNRLPESLKRVDDAQAITFFADLVHTLVTLHSQAPPYILGALHPHDVVISPAGARIIEFRLVEHLFPEVSRLLAPPASGFVAPEARMSTTLDPRQDVYSVAAIIYWMLTGVEPVVNARSAPTLRATLEEARPQLSADVANLLLEMLSFYPSGRPASASAVLERLQPHVPEEPPPVPSEVTEAPAIPDWVPEEDRIKPELVASMLQALDAAQPPPRPLEPVVEVVPRAAPAAPAPPPDERNIIEVVDDLQYAVFKGDRKRQGGALLWLVGVVLIVWMNIGLYRFLLQPPPEISTVLMEVVSGAVQIKVSGRDTEWRDEKVVRRPDTLIQTAPGQERSVLRFGSDHQLRLDKEAMAQCTVNGQDIRVTVLRGRLWLHLKAGGSGTVVLGRTPVKVVGPASMDVTVLKSKPGLAARWVVCARKGGGELAGSPLVAGQCQAVGGPSPQPYAEPPPTDDWMEWNYTLEGGPPQTATPTAMPTPSPQAATPTPSPEPATSTPWPEVVPSPETSPSPGTP